MILDKHQKIYGSSFLSPVDFIKCSAPKPISPFVRKALHFATIESLLYLRSLTQIKFQLTWRLGKFKKIKITAKLLLQLEMIRQKCFVSDGSSRPKDPGWLHKYGMWETIGNVERVGGSKKIFVCGTISLLSSVKTRKSRVSP